MNDKNNKPVRNKGFKKQAGYDPPQNKDTKPEPPPPAGFENPPVSRDKGENKKT